MISRTTIFLALMLTLVALGGCIPQLTGTQQTPAASAQGREPMPGVDGEGVTYSAGVPRLVGEDLERARKTAFGKETVVSAAGEPEPREGRLWGEPDATKVFRPGIHMDDGSCTTNFLFHENWTRFFLGTAAHCVSEHPGTGDRAYDYCHSTSTDASVKLTGRDGSTATAVVAYSSFEAMTRLNETDQDTCGNNDFALLKLPANVMDRVHPAVLFFGGPTALDTHTLRKDDHIYFFGNSGLRDGEVPYGHPGESELGSDCYGEFRAYEYGGWDFDWDFYTQPQLLDGKPTMEPIPGDSGGPFIGPTGHALGMLGGGANNLEYALAWMEANLPWHVELVTWHDFSPDGIEPMKPI